MEYRKKRIDRGIKIRSSTLYGIGTFKDLIYLASPRLILIFGLLILPIIVPGFYWQKVICLFGVYAMLSIALDFLSNYVGLNCLGMAFFLGIGGYLSGLLNAKFSLPIYITIPIASVVGSFICTIALLPTLRLRGVYFTVISFMYPLILAKIIAATGIFGGNEGITGLSILSNNWFNQYFILIILLLCTFGLRRLVTEDIGIVFRGIKDNDQAIISCGINITLYKAFAVFITGIIGCFTGAFLSHLYGWVGLSLLAMDFSIFPLAAIVVGGSGTIVGALVGAIILVPCSEIFRQFQGLRIIFYSTLIVLFILFFSEGIFKWGKRKYEQFEIKVKV